jgi:15-cis-phytoene synthase
MLASPIPLSSSFAWCRRLARETAKNFYYAFQVLPRSQARAMDALYAFMRVTDDIADEEGETADKRRALADWRGDLDAALAGAYSHPLHPALDAVVQRHRIPRGYLHAVIDGVQSDLEPVRFATFAELYRYCYHVASAVGLACIRIWGFRDPRAEEYAEAAGVAFQLTNILRDLGEDLDRGRVYLPQEEIERFDCPPESWRNGQRSDAFRRLMRFQVERARGYYARGMQLAPLLPAAGRAVFGVMTRIYRGLLDAIEARGYDVFSSRVRLSGWRKLRLVLGAFPVRWGWA